MFKVEIKNIKKNKQHFLEMEKIMFKLRKNRGRGSNVAYILLQYLHL